MLRATPSFSSSSTLDIGALLEGRDNPSLLKESLSFESLLSFSSTSSVPPFPSDRKPPIALVSDCFGDAASLDCKHPTTLTGPTPPRLRALTTTSRCIDQWLDKFPVAPEHTPWGDNNTSALVTWIPEGSVYSPDAFKEALAAACSARNSVPVNHHLSLSPGDAHRVSTPSPRASTNGSNRDALVIDREVTLRTGKKVRRWSMYVPGGRDESPACSEALEKSPPSQTPSLVVSNSHVAFPLSLESYQDLSHQSPTSVPLLQRRGQFNLPPLELNNDTNLLHDSYPNIPTAFRGSPVTDSPVLDANDITDARPTRVMSVMQMITNLRLQCQSIPSGVSPSDDSFPPAIDDPPPANEVSRVSGVSDEWAFAQDLQSKFDSSSSLKMRASSEGTGPSASESQNLTQCSGSSSGFAYDLFPKPPNARASERPPSAPPPATLLQSPPSLRGILKSGKSVRFASLPNRRKSALIDFMPKSPPPPLPSNYFPGASGGPGIASDGQLVGATAQQPCTALRTLRTPTVRCPPIPSSPKAPAIKPSEAEVPPSPGLRPLSAKASPKRASTVPHPSPALRRPVSERPSPNVRVASPPLHVKVPPRHSTGTSPKRPSPLRTAFTSETAAAPSPLPPVPTPRTPAGGHLSGVQGGALSSPPPRKTRARPMSMAVPLTAPHPPPQSRAKARMSMALALPRRQTEIVEAGNPGKENVGGASECVTPAARLSKKSIGSLRRQSPQTDENAVRRQTILIPTEAPQKSRMPLRNIFRFK
ncbi:hypothetical protein FISHEDRAFT_68974 [Fistulina hepatica ATCC 64428]|uniref:Uncharacterized protein n=1 Tax=Fistulina hepatica ATCC 64428 TaxID=1128425 RepID=A0A0D7ARD7_9AGAR|nr:hypothetical protein FISHEDRAFT_68974 [Fistulina hepatica ATCC 64428]